MFLALLSIDQIIPTPEAKEFMIGMKVKEEEEKSTEAVLKDRHRIRLDFWEKTLESFRNSECKLYNYLSASKDHWLSAGSGVSGCPFVLIFAQTEIRVELSLMRSKAEENDFLFRELKKQQDKIEGSFGKNLIWNQIEGRKASRIQFSRPFDGNNRDNWPEMIKWLVSNMTSFEKVLRQPLSEVASKLKSSQNF